MMRRADSSVGRPRTVLALAAVLPGILLAVGAVAEELAVKHPILDHTLVPRRARSYEQAEPERVMAMSEAEMLRLIPTRQGVLFCGCPNCSGGQQESNQFDWSIDRPFELRCKYCGHVYPSEKYAPNRTDTGTNELGETVSYRYYFDEKSGRDFWLEAHADYLRRAWFVVQCLALAREYHKTHRPEHARRAALILNVFARAFPHMAAIQQWPYQRRRIMEPVPPYASGGRWGRNGASEVPHSLPEAYDLIYDSGELERLSREEGVDARQRINDFFRGTVRLIWAFEPEPTGIHLNNLAEGYVFGIINIGRLIGEPEFVHWGYRWVGNILRDGFCYDGMWHESPSYHYHVGGIRRIMLTLKGYSDPPGYRSPKDGLRLDNVDLQQQIPFLQKAVRAPDAIAYPNGHICPVHDSWASSHPSPVREQTVSTILPGFGHASLGRSRGKDQLQAQLHFSGGYGHQHYDSLNFSLFAKGAEMLSDIGYTHSKLRAWAISTAGHNTVVIDRKNQSSRNSDGDLLLFVPDLAGLAAVEACGERAYPELAETYRRLLLLVPVSESDAYVVDIFRVKGGSTHDWLLHGSANEEMTAECSLPLTPFADTLLEPGEEWKEPIGESSTFSPYGVIREARRAQTDGSFDMTLRYAAPEGPTAGAGVRLHWVGSGNSEVFLAKSPRVRPAEGDDNKVYDFLMPQLVVRRRGSSPLSSTFAAVHEPFGTKSFIDGVRALPLDPPGEFSAALEVRCGEFTDTVVSTLDEPPYPQRRLPNGAVVRGRLVILRERAGRPEAAWMLDGIEAAKGGLRVSLDAPRYEGAIESATRREDGAPEDAFITSPPLPVGEALSGQWMVVTHGNGYTHGYEVARVERHEGRSVIILRDDHGLRIAEGQTQECYFPGRTIPGVNRFLLIGASARRWESPSGAR
ncbi:MAG: heparinase II/III family protein [Armatimonadetes bacterium]|nr:heparinase II/III family protein [Armatimonadota bacterium]